MIKAMEPVTNRDLTLGYPNRFIQREAKSESGAGANAGSASHTTFVGTEPPYELVASPQKSLSIRRADGSFSKKRFSLLCGAGMSNMGSGSNANEPIDKENLITSAAVCNGTRHSSAGFPIDDAGTMPLYASSVELKTGDDILIKDVMGEDVYTVLNIEVAESSEGRENKISKSPDKTKMDVVQNDPNPEEPIVRVGDVGHTVNTLGVEISLTSEVHSEEQCGSYDVHMQNVLPSREGLELSSASAEKVSKNYTDLGSSSLSPLQKQESSGENDLRALLAEIACCATRRTTKIVAEESGLEVGNNARQDSKILCRDKSLEANISPTTNRIQRDQMKGKAEALSDGNVSGRMPDEDDDSQESVDSCNTGSVVSTGKRRQSFEQQLIVRSKRVKRQIQENPSSTSFFKQDSSFMSWISNMMKGFTKSNEDEAPSLLDHNHGNESPCQNLIACNRNHDAGHRAAGFQSIFSSLYCPRTRTQEVNTLNANYQADGSKELNLDTKVCDIDATPTSCCMVAGDFNKRFLVSSEKINESASGYGIGSMLQPKDTCLSNPSIQEINRSGSVEMQNLHDFCKERKGRSSNSCEGKCKTNTGENLGSESLSEGKTTNNFAYKSNPLASLWVTRFTPKSYSPFSNQDPCSKSTCEALDSSIDGMKLKPLLNNHLRSCDDRKNIEGRKCFAKDPSHAQTFETSADSPLGSFNMKSQHDEKSMCKVGPILPSPRLRNSEVMASVFAMRLDALKQIIPLDVTNNAACASWTCFLSGLKGHNLRNCPKVSSSDLEEVLRNINSYIGTEELPCLCVRCFQPDHWAVACPNASSNIRDEVEHGYPVVDECAHNNPQLGATNQYNSKMLDGRDGQLQAAVAATEYDGNDPGTSKGHNFKCKSDEASSSGKLEGNADLFEKDIASSCIQNKLKENKIMHFFGFSNKHILNFPKGIFDSLKMLQLSRKDILKWMKSCLPLSHLDGFFLRLRLGKWEQGLGGTRYYVAHITGVQKESFIQMSENSIAVNVGGIKCAVESKFISNHFFLEDELLAWWSATEKAGILLPSEEYLRQKVKEKQTLGFRPNI